MTETVTATATEVSPFPWCYTKEVKEKAFNPRIFVLCWAFDNRLDQRGGAGYSYHLSEEDANKWEKEFESKLPNDQKGFARYYLCGKGFVKNPAVDGGMDLSEFIQDKMISEIRKSTDGVYEEVSPFTFFFEERTPGWLIISSGVTPGTISRSFAEEEDSRPD